MWRTSVGIAMVCLGVAFGTATAQEAKKKGGSVTILTSAKMTTAKDSNGKDVKAFLFAASAESKLADAVQSKTSAVGGSKAAITKQKQMLANDEPFMTNGAIVETKGTDGVTLEIIDIGEFKARYPDLVKENPKLNSAGGFCALMGGGGSYYCDKASCTGTCKLHNIPVYCSCD